MVKSISKKCLSILMILVLMFSIFTIPVHGEVLTMTTAVGVAVVAGALIAAGVYVANPSTRQAINAAAQDFISRVPEFLSTAKCIATATGKVFALWTSDIWNKFTDWIKNTLCTGNVALTGYAMPVSNNMPMNASLSSCQHIYTTTSDTMQDFYIGGTRITNAYTSSSVYQARLSNGYFSNNFSFSAGAELYIYNGCYGTPTAIYIYHKVSDSSARYNLINMARGCMVYNSWVQGFNVFYGDRVYANDGNNNHFICEGFSDISYYLWACVSAGLFLGDWTWVSNGTGQNVPVRDHFSPNVRIQYADNSIPGLSDAQSGLIGAIGGALPFTAQPGQNIMTPVWGTWVNGDGIPIGWAGPQGTYGTPSSTITPGTTIAGSNPPVAYPGDDVIDPTLGRDGVATFPTLGDDVINPADDTFITDLDDYIDPTIDRLTTPTDVSTLTQNPTDVVGRPATDVYPESHDIPNPISDTADDTIPDVDSPAIPDVDTATDTATPINPDASDDTSTDERNTNRLKLSTLILSKFPFCIPWDIYRTVATMAQEPEIPSFDWRFSLPSFNVDETIHIDFEQFETVAYIVRWFLSACWLVTLVLLTRKVIWK